MEDVDAREEYEKIDYNKFYRKLGQSQKQNPELLSHIRASNIDVKDYEKKINKGWNTRWRGNYDRTSIGEQDERVKRH